MMGSWLVEVWRYRDFLRNLILKDFKIRYQGSVLGFVWTLLTPLVSILIYLVAFKYIVRIDIPRFDLFLITGILPWTFFSISLSMSTDSIVGNGNLIKKIRFPRESLPIATVLFNFLHLVLAFVVFFPIILILGGEVSAPLLALPLVVALHVLLAIGGAFFLSSTTVFYQDLRPITDLGLMALFWLTPIVYDISLVPPAMRPIWEWGPLAGIIQCYQDIIYRSRFPGWDAWFRAALWASVSVVVGSATFRKLESRFAEEL